jgi:hypothetical protein
MTLDRPSLELIPRLFERVRAPGTALDKITHAPDRSCYRQSATSNISLHRAHDGDREVIAFYRARECRLFESLARSGFPLSKDLHRDASRIAGDLKE